MAKRKAKKVQRYWCGFCDDVPHFENTTDEYGDCPQLTVFKSRQQARRRYEDVREVVLPSQGKKGGDAR